MTLGRAGGLELVVRLAREAETAAAARLQQAETWLTQSQARLESIERYLQEYRARARTAVSVPARGMCEERRFLLQLEETLVAQSRLLEQQRRGAETARSEWLALRTRRDSLETLLEGRARTELDRRERIDQQRLDDRPRPAPQNGNLWS